MGGGGEGEQQRGGESGNDVETEGHDRDSTHPVSLWKRGGCVYSSRSKAQSSKSWLKGSSMRADSHEISSHMSNAFVHRGREWP